MFSQASVRHSDRGGGPHGTIIHDTLGYRTYPYTRPDMGPTLPLTFGGHHWRPVQSCLLEHRNTCG